MLDEYKIKKYKKVNMLSQEVVAYDLLLADPDKYVLGSMLSGSLKSITSLWIDITQFKAIPHEEQQEYLDNKYGTWNDVIIPGDEGDCFLYRENTNHNLGMIGCLSYIESLCGVFYRFSDQKVFIKHYQDDSIPLYETTFEEFTQIVEWWIKEVKKLEAKS